MLSDGEASRQVRAEFKPESLRANQLHMDQGRVRRRGEGFQRLRSAGSSPRPGRPRSTLQSTARTRDPALSSLPPPLHPSPFALPRAGFTGQVPGPHIGGEEAAESLQAVGGWGRDGATSILRLSVSSGAPQPTSSCSCCLISPLKHFPLLEQLHMSRDRCQKGLPSRSPQRPGRCWIPQPGIHRWPNP